MTNRDFSDAALVILGHGTDLNPGSALPARQHAAELQRRRLFADVRAAYWKQDPRITEVLATLNVPRVFIVPLFISEGYFCEQVIPRALGFELTGNLGSRVRSQATSRWYYCQPVGTHERMTEVILARAREVLARFPFPRMPDPGDLTLFIAGHGTERSEQSRHSIQRQVDLIRARQLYAGVEAVFMDDEPRIGDCYTMVRTRHLVLVPFFVSDGLHVREDIPRLLGEPADFVQARLKEDQPTWRNPTERQGRLVWYASAVGTEVGLAEVILDRVAEAANIPATL